MEQALLSRAKGALTLGGSLQPQWRKQSPGEERPSPGEPSTLRLRAQGDSTRPVRHVPMGDPGEA